MKTKLYRELKLKDGTVLPQGLEVNARPHPEMDNVALVTVDNSREYKLRITSIKKPPSLKTLEKYVMDGISRSVSGAKVEPDGKDADGWASWLMVVGVM